jgi:hypothetical protein
MRANRLGFFSLGSISTARKKLTDQTLEPDASRAKKRGFANALDAVHWLVSRSFGRAKKLFRIFFRIIQHNRKEWIRSRK